MDERREMNEETERERKNGWERLDREEKGESEGRKKGQKEGERTALRGGGRSRAVANLQPRFLCLLNYSWTKNYSYAVQH